MHTRIGTLLLLALGLLASAASAQQEEFVVIKAGHVITATGEEIERGEIVIVDGKIRLIGRSLEYPPGTTVIDARDETVMPGLIHPRTRHDLPGYRRSGVNGQYTVGHELDLDAFDFEPLLEHGFTAVAFHPAGDDIPGVAGVYRTAWPEDMDPYAAESQVLRPVSWLRILMSNLPGDKRMLRKALNDAQSDLDKIEKARAEFEKKQKEAAEKKKQQEAQKKEKPKPDQAAEKDGENSDEKQKEEAPTFKPPRTDPGRAPLRAWLQDELEVPPLVELGDAAAFLHLQEVLDARDELQPPNLMLNPGRETAYHHILEELAAYEGLLLLDMELNELPSTSTRFNLPGELEAAGADIVLMPERMLSGFALRFRQRSNAPDDISNDLRSFRGRLADLIRSGLSRDTAIRAMTIHPARLLGVDDSVGSIEVDKDADLIFLDGDAVDPHATVTRVMILGKIVWEDDA